VYIYIPVFFSKNPISIGSNQYVTSENLSTLGDFLFTSIIGPFNEELVFRFLLLYYVPFLILSLLYKVRKLKNYIDFFIKKKKALISFWVILISSLFSLMHGPDLWSFMIYFPGG